MATFSKTAKGRTLRSLSRTKEKAQRLEFTLRLAGDAAGADQIDLQIRELGRQIDHLIKEAMTEWLGNAKTIESDLKANNEKLQNAIHDIQKGVRTAHNIVRAVGFIDDAIAIAGKLLPPVQVGGTAP